MIAFLWWAAWLINSAWFYACLAWWICQHVRQIEPSRPIVWLASELRPLYIPTTIILGALMFKNGISFWDCWSFLGMLIGWFMFKDKHDDRWKKRRSRLKEKVEQRGAKLVVVPTS